jgi:hypothetical protein
VEVLQEQRHPNVVLFMGVCVRPPAVITEFCESGSLNKLLEQVRNVWLCCMYVQSVCICAHRSGQGVGLLGEAG